jgi:hypothetical protein
MPSQQSEDQLQKEQNIQTQITKDKKKGTNETQTKKHKCTYTIN